jgi:hypothetical protein
MRSVIAALALAAATQSGAPVQTIKDGILDDIKLYVQKLPSTQAVVVRPFSATDADIVNGEKKEETKKMQVDAPKMIADELAAKLKEFGGFASISVLEAGATPPADAIVVEGKFTEMDPGSRAKRYFVGYGAGKSAVTAEGAVKSADGTVLATFTQRRVGTMGVGGGDSMKKLTSDTKSIGEDVAKFLSAWAGGKKLK